MTLKSSQKVALFVAVALVASVIGFFSLAGAAQSSSDPAAGTTAQQSEATDTAVEIGSEEWEAQILSREKAEIIKILADPRVGKYTDGALSVHHEFDGMEFNEVADVFHIHLVQHSNVEGDWQTSYKYTTSGRYDIDVQYKDGEIISVDVIPLPDFVEDKVFDETTKKIIAMALADEATKWKIGDRTDIWIPGVYSETDIRNTCPYGSCHVVTVMAENSKEAFGVWVNSDTGSAVSFTTSQEWADYEASRQ